MTLEENLLIVKAKKGDVSAFEELIYRYDKKVLAIASSFRNSTEDAKDIYQEVFLRVYKGIKNFEGKSEFSTWLFRITANVCLTYKSKKKKFEYASINREFENEQGETTSLSNLIEGEDSADKNLLNKEISDQLNVALNSLPEKQKLAFTLKHIHEYKIKEIAAMMNCTEGTIKKYLFIASQKLREKLKGLTDK